MRQPSQWFLTKFYARSFNSSRAIRSGGDSVGGTRKRLGYRISILSLLGLFLAGLLALPFSQFTSSAQNEKGQQARTRQAQKRDESAPRVSAPQPMSTLAVPNDTCATAIPLTYNQSVNGTLSTAVNDYQLSGAGCFTGIGQTPAIADGGDAVYSFTAFADGLYSFRVTDVSGVGDLIIYTASSCPAATPGTPVTVATCLTGANRNAVQASEEVSLQSLAAGQQVFIFIDQPSGSPTTTFSLEVTAPATEAESNDTPATATPYFFNTEARILPGTDLDYFSLSTSPGQRIFALVDGSAGNGSDFDLRVTNTTDTLEYDDDNNFFAFGNLSPNVGGTVATGTQTYLQVSSKGGTAREPYRLFAIVEPPSTSAFPEIEPNDTTATATNSPTNYYSGNITPAADVDVYRIQASAGDIIFAGYDGDPTRNGTTVDGTLTLLNSGGTTLITVNDPAFTSNLTPGTGNLASTTPNAPAEAFVYRIQTTGTYYVRVNGNFGDTGDYLLALSLNLDTSSVFSPGDLLISEFRLNGSNANDEFIELYNNTNFTVLVGASDASTGFSVATSDGVVRCTIPNGTLIPGRGHFLCANSAGYSISPYPAGNGTTATPDATYATDIPQNVGIALFTTTNPANFTLANRLDAVGSTSEANALYKEGAGYSPPPVGFTNSSTFSIYRNMPKATNGFPQDTNDNAADFVLVASTGLKLGAAGPENLSSPIYRTTGVPASLIDPLVSNAAPPNRVRDTTPGPPQTSSAGTLSIRRTFTNNTGGPITRLRFRIVDITAGLFAPPGTADLRAISSTSVIVNTTAMGTITAQGTTLEEPPIQGGSGGGFNSSLSANTVTLASPIAPGGTVSVQLLFGVQQAGNFRLLLNVERLP